MTYLIDTNIFLRVLIRDDEKIFKECFRLLEAIKLGKIHAIVPGVVISEMVWTLSSFYKLPKAQVIEAIQGILHLNGIEVLDMYEYSEALKLYASHKAKYIDCVIASMILDKNEDFAVISFDQEFDKLGVTRLEPKGVK